MNINVVKKNVLTEEKVPLVQLKINPDCLELVNDIKLYYRFKSVNELIKYILSGNELSKSSSTLELSKINKSLSSNLTQAAKIFNYFLDKAFLDNDPETLADFAKLRKALGVNDEYECKTKFLKIVNELPKSIDKAVASNLRTTDDSSPMILEFKRKINTLDIHKNAPPRKNIWIRLDKKTYRSFFKKQVSSVDPFNRRALWIGLKEKANFKILEINPVILEQIRAIHNEINDCNTLMNSIMKKKGSVGVFDTYKTYAKSITTLNKILGG